MTRRTACWTRTRSRERKLAEQRRRSIPRVDVVDEPDGLETMLGALLERSHDPLADLAGADDEHGITHDAATTQHPDRRIGRAATERQQQCGDCCQGHQRGRPVGVHPDRGHQPVDEPDGQQGEPCRHQPGRDLGDGHQVHPRPVRAAHEHHQCEAQSEPDRVHGRGASDDDRDAERDEIAREDQGRREDTPG